MVKPVDLFQLQNCFKQFLELPTHNSVLVNVNLIPAMWLTKLGRISNCALEKRKARKV